jgi:hypothetical protein
MYLCLGMVHDVISIGSWFLEWMSEWMSERGWVGRNKSLANKIIVATWRTAMCNHCFLRVVLLSTYYSYLVIQLEFWLGVGCFAYNLFHVRYVLVHVRSRCEGLNKDHSILVHWGPNSFWHAKRCMWFPHI